MPARRIEFHPAAVEEARGAIAWYRERSTKVAERFARELRAALLAVERHPQRARALARGVRRHLVRGFPYLIVYTFDEAVIQVLAVAHARRRPGYWRPRCEG